MQCCPTARTSCFVGLYCPAHAHSRNRVIKVQRSSRNNRFYLLEMSLTRSTCSLVIMATCIRQRVIYLFFFMFALLCNHSLRYLCHRPEIFWHSGLGKRVKGRKSSSLIICLLAWLFQLKYGFVSETKHTAPHLNPSLPLWPSEWSLHDNDASDCV